MKVQLQKWILGLILLVLSFGAVAQIPSDKVLDGKELFEFLRPGVKDVIANVVVLEHGSFDEQYIEETIARYFREKFRARYFYDYTTNHDRFSTYNQYYQQEDLHKHRADDHLEKYKASTQWKLPFENLQGQPVNAYALRHLARQHKMVDIAFQYYYQDQDPKYIQYFEEQLQSLNDALVNHQYETIADGNGVYEAFRSGYRILNWLWIHNLFLGEEEYSDKDQLRTIATLLQTAQDLYERNAEFKAGNHQTRGMSALAMVAILFSDVQGADLWYDRAMTRLGEHLDQEINDDGFQFERSVHYHMSDINNYFYVYQLIQKSNLDVDEEWEEKLKTLFSTLTKIAYPNQTTPVLQDDTEIPWAEWNDISGIMSLGYLLFEDPEIGYFASNTVRPREYWFLSDYQLERLNHIDKQRPSHGSLSFEDTHYYIMREGWDADHKMLVISAGLDELKPDHQHGDMLGIQAYANENVLLPNYQVRYSLDDYAFFKNSMVKNVALVDDQLQGREYTSNKGGSGFGKFKRLPNPSVIEWQSKPNFDLFIGSHDGFEDVGVHYQRQIVYVKDDFWIVKDNFQSSTTHTYKQVWQGHYTTEEGADLIRSTFANASGLDILQIMPTDTVVTDGKRGKHWAVIAKEDQNNFSFITLLYPYQGYNNRISETDPENMISGWTINKTEASVFLSKNNQSIVFQMNSLQLDDQRMHLSQTADIYIQEYDNYWELTLLSPFQISISVHDKMNGQLINMIPGEMIVIDK